MTITPTNSDPFVHFRRRHAARPFIVAQLGQSLDGRIATRTGDSRTIGAAPSLDHLHAIRAHVDAVVVGIGTVLADDPLLNVRRCAGTNPARVVIDARGRLPATAKCLDGADGARRIVLRGPQGSGVPQGSGNQLSAEPTPAEALPQGVEIVTLPVDAAGHFGMDEVARALGRLGFDKVLIEGGAGIVSQAIDAGIVDRLHLMISAVILGSGKPGLDLRPIDLVRDALRPPAIVTSLGQGDVLFDCDFSALSPSSEVHA